MWAKPKKAYSGCLRTCQPTSQGPWAGTVGMRSRHLPHRLISCLSLASACSWLETDNLNQLWTVSVHTVTKFYGVLKRKSLELLNHRCLYRGAFSPFKLFHGKTDKSQQGTVSFYGIVFKLSINTYLLKLPCYRQSRTSVYSQGDGGVSQGTHCAAEKQHKHRLFSKWHV